MAGEVVCGLWKASHEISMAYQIYSLYPEGSLTVKISIIIDVKYLLLGLK
jgi:hypothetical protein